MEDIGKPAGPAAHFRTGGNGDSAPCSVHSMGRIAAGESAPNLLIRAADVCLKGRRRRTDYSWCGKTPLHFRTYCAACWTSLRWGAIHLPPVPGLSQSRQNGAGLGGSQAWIRVLDMLVLRQKMLSALGRAVNDKSLRKPVFRSVGGIQAGKLPRNCWGTKAR